MIELSPPELTKTAQALYPAHANERRIEADVVLALTIDSSGHVAEASAERVVLRAESTSSQEDHSKQNGSVPEDIALEDPALEEAFMRAAEQAALGFEFAPAKRGDVLVAAHIRYLYEFRLPPLEDEPEVTTSPAPASVATGGAPSVTSIAPAIATPEQSTSKQSDEPKVHEVQVKGKTVAQQMKESAETVKVVGTEEARKESADMGEVLARTPGVSIRRSGGLGKGTQISLNGFGGDRVRIFVDGVPLEYSGYPLDIADFPVNLVERVEIYSGIVPVRFGRDALGGVINIVTNRRRRSHAYASYQAGSFGTQRATARAYHLQKSTGLFAGADASYDYSDNDFLIDVEVPDDVGRLAPYRAHRFHDAYRAITANLELGILNKPWADQLVLRAFYANVEQDIQNRGGRTVPYGSANSGVQNLGGTLGYTDTFGKNENWSIDSIAGYTYTQNRFVDTDTCLYNWFGSCVKKAPAGEITRGSPSDATTGFHAYFARIQTGWKFLPDHEVLLALGPEYTLSGDEENRFRQAENGVPIPDVDLDNYTIALSTGLEYVLHLFDKRLENRAFVKYAVSHSYAESLRKLSSGQYAQTPEGDYVVDTTEITNSPDPGFGDGIRFKFTDWLYAKAAFERGTRPPTHQELFGNGVLILGNPSLKSEKRDAFNLGVGVLAETESGDWRSQTTFFHRLLEGVILNQPVGDGRFTRSDNLYTAASTGIEASAGWTAPGRWLLVDLNGTYQDFRNTSTNGIFADYAGDRIPNTPWLFFNANVRLQNHKVFTEKDTLALTGYLRYVHEYLLGWEDVGRPDTKVVIPSYLLPTVALVYTVEGQHNRFTSSIEVQNISDSLVVDVYGMQRPGRAFYAKMTVDHF